MARKEEVVEYLIAKQAGDQTRSLMGRMREVFDTILIMQNGGSSAANIVEWLNEKWFGTAKPAKGGLTLNTFSCGLSRIRKEQGLEPEEKQKAVKTPKTSVGENKPKTGKAAKAVDVPAGKTKSSDELKILSQTEIDINDFQ